MNRIRFSMTSLMLGVVLCAVTFAALRFTADIWATILSTVVLFVLFTALVSASYNSGVRRAFWIGFALFGWGYWLAVHVPWRGQDRALSTSLADTSIESWNHACLSLRGADRQEVAC